MGIGGVEGLMVARISSIQHIESHWITKLTSRDDVAKLTKEEGIRQARVQSVPR